MTGEAEMLVGWLPPPAWFGDFARVLRLTALDSGLPMARKAAVNSGNGVERLPRGSGTDSGRSRRGGKGRTPARNEGTTRTPRIGREQKTFFASGIQSFIRARSPPLVIVQKCRKICGLGCVNRACARARVMQPIPPIFLHICTRISFLKTQKVSLYR